MQTLPFLRAIAAGLGSASVQARRRPAALSSEEKVARRHGPCRVSAARARREARRDRSFAPHSRDPLPRRARPASRMPPRSSRCTELEAYRGRGSQRRRDRLRARVRSTPVDALGQAHAAGFRRRRARVSAVWRQDEDPRHDPPSGSDDCDSRVVRTVAERATGGVTTPRWRPGHVLTRLTRGRSARHLHFFTPRSERRIRRSPHSPFTRP